MFERVTVGRAAKVLVLFAAALTVSGAPAAAQSRGVVIKIPDEVAPGAPRRAPEPAPPVSPVSPPAAGSSNAAPTGAAPDANGAKTACQGASCAGNPNAWHVLNTSNKTCLVLSKTDLEGGKDIRRLSALLPAPLFIVASGACP